MKRKLKVEAIENGTVIDHIPAGKGIRILKFFQLADDDQRLTVGINLPTHDGGKKDLIKVENIAFTSEQANQLALFAPKATINVIDQYEVVNKFNVALPESIKGVLDCPNSNCITHSESVASKFALRQNINEVKLKCHYCEKSFDSRFFHELD
ncbi:aspartate carbamoyltransferase regulatory subunit [Alginatibacterium sediminis]|uniref:Aspartate carbamoyltransferase regulatory chain n=1 Tax=Alginatibacterium sediminis TaxID=2164068 RepID=A0A420E6T8_9ALTE|nr:aspartate carbamoyltransferase regulatory subunit [Alginatibacterium sediminis]RKF13205.1 aspartate carbamoyltransferase regulatory subunit [Alginatibacterium sediminis]